MVKPGRPDAIRRGGLLAAAFTACFLLIASGAEGFIYWANGNTGTIGRANNDGTGVIQNLVTGIGGPCGVAVNDTHIYWAAQGGDRIGRANLDGSGVTQILIAPAFVPCGVALDDSFVYWGHEDEAVGRANLDGTGVISNFAAAANSTPCGVAVDSSFVYWTSFGGPNQSVGRAEINGSNPDPLFVNGAVKPCGVAVNGTHLFWANNDAGNGTSIGRSNLDGTDPDQTFINGQNGPCGLALDDAHIYWANQGGTAIGRADLDGSDAQLFIGGASAPCGVAIDDLALPTCQPLTAQTTLDQSVTIDLSSGCTGQGPLTFENVTAPSEGLLKDLDPVAGTVRYIPVGGFTGQDAFNYTGSNVGGPAAVQTVTVNVLPPPNDFTTTVRRNRRAGTASLTVQVPVGGELGLTGARIRGVTRETLQAGQVVMPVRPTGKVKRRLAKRGFAPVSFTVTFTPINGSANAKPGTLTLTKRR